MKKLKLLIPLIIIFFTAGCWNYRELNDLALVSAIGIDEEDGLYKVSVQIMDPTQESGGSNTSSSSEATPIDVHFGKGKTIVEALNNITLNQPKRLFLGHTDLIVISDTLARKGIEDFIDFLLRERESRKIFPVVIVKNAKAIDVIKLITSIEVISAKSISSSLKNTKNNNGIVSDRLFDEVSMCLFMEGREATITAMELIGSIEQGEKKENQSTSEPNTTFLISGSAVLIDDKVIGYLPQKESLGYTFLRGLINTSTISVPCDDEGNYAGIVLEKTKTKLTTKIEEDKPIGEINIDIKAVISEFNCNLDLNKSRNITKVEKATNKEIEKLLDDTINKVQTDFKSDIFGFGEYLYKNNYKTWQKYKKDWNKLFSTMPYKIKVKTIIRNVGTTIDSTKNSYKKDG
ncbi:MAG: Ger(x)C family spore germination protein [Bacilli bacterium]|nr:Ger(x)C family spore germination protein [Bacilli bacterium]MDD4808954.1 Ger(x)C family spore germination protein [Bacilli bacterium]